MVKSVQILKRLIAVGNSTGIIIPRSCLKELNIDHGDWVMVTIDKLDETDSTALKASVRYR